MRPKGDCLLFSSDPKFDCVEGLIVAYLDNITTISVQQTPLCFELPTLRSRQAVYGHYTSKQALPDAGLFFGL